MSFFPVMLIGLFTVVIAVEPVIEHGEFNISAIESILIEDHLEIGKGI